MKYQNLPSDESNITHVLVEEEKVIRDKWLRIAAEKNIALMTYPDAEWFLDDLSKGVFRGGERFYLDQDFGQVRGVGLRLSQQIKSVFPQAYTCLVTAYPKLMFRRELIEGLVNDVSGKYPSPFDNPSFTEFENKYERDVWLPLLAAGACN